MTVLFEDQFETGDFSAWTGNVAQVSVVNTTSHHGSYCAKLANSGTADSACYKTFGTTYNMINGRVYAKVASIPLADGGWLSLLGFHMTGVVTNGVAYAGLANSGGIIKWFLKYRTFPGTWGTAYSATPTIDLNQWYCLEIKHVGSPVAGEDRLYIDGVEVIAITGLNNNDRGDPAGFLGFGWLNGVDSVSEAYIDCTVCSDSPSELTLAQGLK